MSNRALDIYSQYMKPAPSQPRAMRGNDPMVKIERAMEPRKFATNLPAVREVDLQKWPCHKCHFVHRGSECERSCIGCKSHSYKRHDLMCPYRNKIRIDDEPPRPYVRPVVKQEESVEPLHSLNRGFNDLFPPSPTMRLSMECQKRGFNPAYTYYGNTALGKFKADLYIKGTHISGNGIVYHSQKDARDALAKQGLDVVLKMYPGPDAGRLQQNRPRFKNEDGLFDKPSLNEATRALTPVILGSSMRPTERQPIAMARMPPHQDMMDIDSPSHCTRRSPEVELPGNIDPHMVGGMLRRAFSNSTNPITVNLPANVSVEVAQAYAKGLSTMAIPSHRIRYVSRSRARSRSRSRSHARSRSPPRDRLYDRYYRDRDNHPPPRGTVDAYRPSRDGGLRIKVEEDSRHRLSPPQPRPRHSPPRRNISRKSTAKVLYERYDRC